MAKITDMNRKQNRFLTMLVGMLPSEQILLALLLVKTGTYMTAAFFRNNDIDRLYLAVLISEAAFSVGLVFLSGLRRAPLYFLRFLYTMGISVLYCFALGVNGMVSDYLQNVQLRVAVVALQIGYILFLLLFTLFNSITGFRDLIGVRAKQKTQKKKAVAYGVINIAAVTFAALLVYFTVYDMDTISVGEEVYQVAETGFVSYTGRSKIKKAGTGCTIENVQAEATLLSTPLYYTTKQQILLTQMYAVIRPSLSLSNKVLNLSTITKKNDGYLLCSEGKEIMLWNFFLFDGKNTYIFFEDTTLKVGNQVISIEPFSFCTAVYNKSLTVYRPGTMEYTVLPVGKENLIVQLSDGTGVNIGMDIIYRTDGQEQMLFVQPGLLEEIKE